MALPNFVMACRRGKDVSYLHSGKNTAWDDVVCRCSRHTNHIIINHWNFPGVFFAFW